MKSRGYAGEILFVDLSTRTWREEPLDTGLARKFIGGIGIGFRLLQDLLKAGVDPLSPENPVIIGLGPLGGTLTPGSGKCSLTMKYPIPAAAEGNKCFVSNATGGSRRFGVMMKNAGYDNMVITGRAEKPCYLLVRDEGVEFCDAEEIWGKDIHQTNELLVKKHGGRTGKCGVWAIGQAGENLVRISQATLDNLNSLGRNVGAVLGSKNLKAVVTLGSKGIGADDPGRFLEFYQEKRKQILAHPHYQPWPRLHGGMIREMFETTVINVKACTGCLGACRSSLQVKEGRFKGESFQGGDVSVPVDFGRRLRIEDYGAMYKLIDLMNRYGLCMLTTLRMIYFVTRMYERGVISSSDTGGLKLRVGDVDAYISLVHKIVNKQDIGAAMAEGWHHLSRTVGVDASAEFKDGCSIVKGVDTLTDSRFWPSHFSPSMGVCNIVHSKGKHAHGATYWPAGPDLSKETYWPHELQSLEDVKRDTRRMGLSEEEMAGIFTENSFNSGRLAKHTQDAEYLYNALGVCDCVVHWECDPTRDVPWLAQLYCALTGFNIPPRELLRAGERIFNLERMLNIREGFTRNDDRIPEVWLENTTTPIRLRSGDRFLTDWFGNRLTKEDIEGVLDDYYEERGWDTELGRPTTKKLAELGLEEMDKGR